MNLVLFGIKGCGKTTLGKEVAKKLKRAFIDTDILIEDLYHMHRKTKLSCREIFKKVGPLGFRSLEYEAIQSLQDVQNSVISVGGGAMMLFQNVEALSQNGLLIYLIVDKEILKKRLFSQESLPPFLDSKNPESSFERLYLERDEVFKKFHTEQIDITKMDIETATHQICQLFKTKLTKNG